MKKLQNVGKTIVLTLLIVTMMTTTCYADVVFSPVAHLKGYLPYVDIVIIILGVLLVIALVCALIGKINKSEQLMTKSLMLSEQITYYWLISICIAITIFELATVFIFAIIPFAVMVASLFYRLYEYRRAVSYSILIGYYIVLLIILIS